MTIAPNEDTTAPNTAGAGSAEWSTWPVRRRSQAGGWWVRTRGTRVAYLLAGLVALNVLDLGCTVFAQHYLRLTSPCEANPIAARILPLGPAAVMLFKALLVTAGTIGLLACRRRRLVEIASTTVLLANAFAVYQWKLYFELEEVRFVLERIWESDPRTPFWVAG